MKNVLVFLLYFLFGLFLLEIFNLFPGFLNQKPGGVSRGDRQKWLVLGAETFLSVDKRSKSAFWEFLLFFLGFLNQYFLLVEFLKVVQLSNSLGSCPRQRWLILLLLLLLHSGIFICNLLIILLIYNFSNFSLFIILRMKNFPWGRLLDLQLLHMRQASALDHSFALLIDCRTESAFSVNFVKSLLFFKWRNFYGFIAALVVIKMLEILEQVLCGPGWDQVNYLIWRIWLI